MKQTIKLLLSICLTSSLSFASIQVKNIEDRYSIYDETIPNTTYSSFIGKTLTLTYDAYPTAYSMHLFKKVQGDSLINEDYTHYLEQKNSDQSQPGCTAYQREIKIGSQQLYLDLPEQGEFYYTDAVAIPQYSKIFMIRNDFTIIQGNFITQNGEEFNSMSYYPFPQSFRSYVSVTDEQVNNFQGSMRIIYHPPSDHVFIITSYGALSFESLSSVGNFQNAQSQTDFKNREGIYDVHYDYKRDYLFIAAGAQGVDVYTFKNNQLVYVATILEDFGTIVDVNSRSDGNVLYVLESQKGFFSINIQNIQRPFQTGFNLPISRARAFDFKNNTFIFIASTIHNQDYAVEVFIDFSADQYYFNRYYLDEMQLFDVKVFDHYAILIGYDAHKLIFHSLYSGLINNNFEQTVTFSEPGLMRVFQYQQNVQKKTSLMIGLGKLSYKTFKVEYHLPRVICQSPIKIKEEYVLYMNSTKCARKDVINDNSHFSECRVKHSFNYIVQKPLFLTSAKLIIVAISLIVLILIVLLVLSLYYCWIKWGRVIKVLTDQVNELKKRDRYEEQTNISMSVEMEQQQNTQV